ncbi:MAG TPA: Na+/H+ antiporter NhaA [Thermoanaerobaculia bacterium]|nr:Na+/H+ antiporter NhaA [Thermoanaerobaculia bacterium]
MSERRPQANPAALILLRPFQRFFQLESASGILLLVAAVAALVWANSPFAESYFDLWRTPGTAGLGAVVIAKPLLLWINDGLMAVFFFVVGLEIKREVLVGELASPKAAGLTVAAAIGGMLVPAVIYAALNTGGPGAAGWGVPMATDIAFALGVLALLGSRVPLALKVFVTAVAIVDDLGAVLIIAVFYTDQLSPTMLGVSAVFLLALALINRAGVRRTWPYALLGIGLWVAFLKSGVHATVAGVLLAMTIPASRKIDAPEFLRRAELFLAEFREDLLPGRSEPTKDQQDAVHSLEKAAEQAGTPLARLEHVLHPWVAFFIMPVFALANAGVALGDGLLATMGSPVTLGIVLGLLLGKQVGVLGAAWLAVRLGLAALPVGISWRQVWGVSILCGIGFTMSLFIASLAFGDPGRLDEAKVGILVGSLLAGVAGATALLWRPRRPAGARSDVSGVASR